MCHPKRRSARGRRAGHGPLRQRAPGIPTLLPGEPVTAEALEQLLSLHAGGLRLHGASDPDLRTLLVTAEGR